MNRQRSMLVSLMLTGYAVCGGARAQDSIRLAPHWENGQTFYIEWQWTTENTGAIVGGGEPRKSQRTQINGFLCTVVNAAADGGARLRFTFDRVGLDYKGPDTAYAYDSDDPNAGARRRGRRKPGPNEPDREQVATALKAELGLSYEVELSAAGQITAVHGLDEAQKAISAAKGEPSIQGALVESLGEPAVRFMWDQYFSVYPFKDVQPGERWERSAAGRIGTLDLEYRLDRVEEQNGRRVAVVTYAGRRSEINPEPPADDPNAPRYENVHTKTSGTVRIELQHGQVIDGKETGEESYRVVYKLEDGRTFAVNNRSQDEQVLRVLTPAEREKDKQETAAKAATRPVDKRADREKSRDKDEE